VAGLITVTPVGLVGALYGPIASADDGAVQIVAKVPLLNDPAAAQSGNEVMMDPGARRLVYFSPANHSIRSYNLDTFKLAAELSDQSAAANFPWALDSQTHILYHMRTSFPPIVLEGIDTRTLAAVTTHTLLPQMGDSYAGLYWSDRDQLLYMVYSPTVLFQGAGRSTAIAAIDPSATVNPVVWTSSLPGCGPPLASSANNAAALGETNDGKYLFTVCSTGAGASDVGRLALPTDQQKKSLQGIWNGQADLFPGLVTPSGSSALWVPGRDRMVTMVSSNGGNGWSAYVFDAHSLHFTGAPGLFNPPSDGHLSFVPPAFGVDAASGRLFAQSRAIATQGRDPATGVPCTFVAPGTDALAIDETGISGASVLHFPVTDEGVNGAGHFVGYDASTHNWWLISQHMLPGGPCQWQGPFDASSFVVFHDPRPVAGAPPAADIDGGTLNVAEQTGVTGANTSSDASAYGVRYVLGPAGVDGPVSVPTGGGSCDLNADLSKKQASSNLPITLAAPPTSPQYHAFCNSHGRAATFAHVSRVALDASEVRADAVTGDTDRETARDLEVGTDYSQPGLYTDAVAGYVNTTSGVAGGVAPQPCPSLPPSSDPNQPPTTCDQDLVTVQPYLSGLALPYAPASCGDNGGGAQQGTSTAPLSPHGIPKNSPLTYPGSASVSCSYLQPLAEGRATQSSASVGGPISDPVAAMTVTADAAVSRTVSDGSVATATATAKDISVGGILHIASLATSATAKAHGRPGTNTPMYSCLIQGLDVSSAVPLPDNVLRSIPSARCDDPNVQALTAALDSVLTGQLSIQFPIAYTQKQNPPGGADGVVQRQSPRGYLSQVALSELDQTQNAILTNDTDIEQPGMVVTYYLDNSNSRNHLVASFAGVAAAARYGIFNLDDSGGDGGGSLDSGAPPGTGVVSGGDVNPPGDGGITPTTPLPPVQPVKSHPQGIGAVAQAIVDGFRLLFQHPGLIPPVLAVWMLFVGPGYLLSRRRALLNATEGAA
jgi:hypothetical protein